MSRGRARDRVLVSAHRFGAGADRSAENSLPALEASLALGVDYVEFDVQRCDDGSFVVAHEAPGQLEVLAGAVVRYDEVLARVAGRSRAHIDLKLTSPDELYAEPGSTYEVAVVRRALELLGPDQLIVTTQDDRSVRAVRDWGDAEGHDVLVGLSLGRSVRGMSWPDQVRVRISELRPRHRFAESRANLVVAKHTLARLGVAAFARRRDLPLLVWTVDSEASLRHWLRPGRAWLVTTNEPALALAVRDGLRG